MFKRTNIGKLGEVCERFQNFTGTIPEDGHVDSFTSETGAATIIWAAEEIGKMESAKIEGSR